MPIFTITVNRIGKIELDDVISSEIVSSSSYENVVDYITRNYSFPNFGSTRREMEKNLGIFLEKENENLSKYLNDDQILLLSECVNPKSSVRRTDLENFWNSVAKRNIVPLFNIFNRETRIGSEGERNLQYCHIFISEKKIKEI